MVWPDMCECPVSVCPVSTTCYGWTGLRRDAPGGEKRIAPFLRSSASTRLAGTRARTQAVSSARMIRYRCGMGLLAVVWSMDESTAGL